METDTLSLKNGGSPAVWVHASEQEARLLRAVLQSLPWDICVKDREGAVVFENRPLLPPTLDSAGIGGYLPLQTQIEVDGNEFVVEARQAGGSSLAASNELFHTLFDNSVAGIAITDQSLSIIACNRSFEQMLEYAHGELAGISLEAITHPDDIEREKRNIEAHLAMGIDSARIEKRYRTKSGGLVWADVYASVIKDGQGRPQYFSAVACDITDKINHQLALRINEERYRNIIMGISQGVLYFDHNGLILDCNPALEAITGLDREELVGKNISELMSKCYDESGNQFTPGNCPFSRNLSQPGPAAELSFQIRRTDGVSWVSASISPVFNILQGDAKPSIVCTLTDIRELRRKEQDLRKVLDNRERLLSIVAHDLSNPFDAIISYSKMMASSAVNADIEMIHSFSQLLGKSATSAKQMLGSLLEWSRIQSGTMPVRRQKTNVCSIADGSIEQVAEYAQVKGVIVLNEIYPDIEVIADPSMLMTILRNLISNAVKFSPTGSIVRVTAFSAGNSLLISVIDSGVGMTQEQIDMLFSLDTHFTTLGTANEKGSGFGLIISHDFVRLHGGSIWAESVPNEGTSFTFSLPLAVPDGL